MATNKRVYNWPAADTQAVCATQNSAGAGSLIINGTLSNFGTGQIPAATFSGTYRTVSVSSGNNLTGVNFTVSGTYLNSTVSQTIAGPNNGTVYTAQLFETVTSVTVNGAVNAAQVGSGTTGRTRWYNFEYIVPNSSLTASIVSQNTINYSFQQTLDDVGTIAVPTSFDSTGALTGQVASAIGFTNSRPFLYCSVNINTAANGSLVATFLQSGVVNE